jgi:hypothetical protein
MFHGSRNCFTTPAGRETAAKFFSACRFWGLTGKLEHVNLALAPLYPSPPFYPVFFLRRFVGPSFPVLPSVVRAARGVEDQPRQLP